MIVKPIIAPISLKSESDSSLTFTRSPVLVNLPALNPKFAYVIETWKSDCGLCLFKPSAFFCAKSLISESVTPLVVL